MTTNITTGFIWGFRCEVSITHLKQTSTDSISPNVKSDNDTVESPLQSGAGQSRGIFSRRNEIQPSATYDFLEFIDIVV